MVFPFLPLALTAGAGLLSSFQKKRPERTETFSTQTAGQRNLMDEILRSVQGGEGVSPGIAQLFGPLDQAGLRRQFEEGFADPRRREFTERTAPDIRSQFLTAGAGRSSAANEAIQRSGQQMETGLDEALSQALFGAEQQRSGNIRDLLSQLLGLKTQETVLRPGEPSGFEKFIGGLGGGISSGLGTGLGKGFGNIFGKVKSKEG